MFNVKQGNKESGSAKIVALVVLAIVVVGGLAYYSTQMRTDDSDAPRQATGSDAVASTQQGENGEQNAEMAIEPGNPVVAKVNGEEISRLEVVNFIQTLPPQTRQLPIEQLFPAALDQVISARVIADKTEDVNLGNDPEVKKQLDEAKKNIVRNVYIQQQVEKGLTEERLKAAYEQYKEGFPKDIEEVKVRHILLEDEASAKEMVKKLEEGADFATLAKENSTDATAENGGEVGYFAETDVVPEFAKAAFETEVGAYTKKPVKTEFGYHVIEVQEKRVRPPASYEQIKPFLETQLRRVILDEMIREWVAQMDVQRFDINGKPVKEKPAS